MLHDLVPLSQVLILLQNAENEGKFNRLYPVIDPAEDYNSATDEYHHLEEPKIAKDEVELVYAKSNFCIRPNSNENEYVDGFLMVARSVSAMFILSKSCIMSLLNLNT
jgi:hypothetical protein